jgi:sigma-B regulation protein RsbU (phosphoserine phosphatase)
VATPSLDGKPEEPALAVGETRRPSRRLAAPLALDGAIAALDIVAFDGASLAGLLLLGPFLASTLVGPAMTAAVGAYALGLGVTVGLADEASAGFPHILRLVASAAASLLAVWVSYERDRRAAKLRDLEHVADAAQRAILRPVPPVVDALALATRCHSASTEARMGGDFYDVLSTPYGARALIGDARGKGLGAIHLAGVALGSFREAAYAERELEAVARAMDESIARHAGEDAEDFATALLVEFREDSLALASCGHHPALKITASGLEELRPTDVGTPLGLGSRPTATVFSFRSRDRLLLYTDGAVEARAADGAFFDLGGACSSPLVTRRSLDDALDHLLEMLADHAGPSLDDDVALVLAERRAGGAPVTAPPTKDGPPPRPRSDRKEHLMDERGDEQDFGMEMPPDRDTRLEREGPSGAPGHTADEGAGPDLGLEDPRLVGVDDESGSDDLLSGVRTGDDKEVEAR